jgi:hypothetical protein
MIFAQGFTLKKASFLKNIKYIAIFGILGTFLSFFITTFLIYEANQLSNNHFYLDLVIDAKDVHNTRTLSDWEVLLLSACLCSIDTIAS